MRPKLVDPERIALSSSPCHGDVLLLNYEPINLVDAMGIEPTTS